VLHRATALRLTKPDGEIRVVNNPEEVRTVVERIGEMHLARLSPSLAKPELNIRYVRTARKIIFGIPEGMRKAGGKTTFEIQITADREVRLHDLRTGESYEFAPDERVIELKIPVEYSKLSDQELRNLGLGELAAIRMAYNDLTPIPGVTRDRGKRSQRGRLAPVSEAPEFFDEVVRWKGFSW
jgi:hypothetical protein